MDIMCIAARTSDSGTFKPHMPNNSHRETKYERGQILGTARPFSDVEFYSDGASVAALTSAPTTKPPRKHTNAKRELIRQKLSDSIKESNVPYEMRSEYLKTLMEYEDVFSADRLDLGLTDVIQHSIEVTGQEDPSYKAQYRLAFDHLQLIKDNIMGWLQAGLVEKADSRYNAPVFCVPKKQGKGLRVVLDYRAINQKSVPDKYSIRTVDQCLEEIGHADSKVFSCLDLTNGFWQLKMADSDKHFTAFTIPGKGQFQWKVTPQGDTSEQRCLASGPPTSA